MRGLCTRLHSVPTRVLDFSDLNVWRSIVSIRYIGPRIDNGETLQTRNPGIKVSLVCAPYHGLTPPNRITGDSRAGAISQVDSALLTLRRPYVSKRGGRSASRPVNTSYATLW